MYASSQVSIRPTAQTRSGFEHGVIRRLSFTDACGPSQFTALRKSSGGAMFLAITTPDCRFLLQLAQAIE
jgi:hypothetical protein